MKMLKKLIIIILCILSYSISPLFGTLSDNTLETAIEASAGKANTLASAVLRADKERFVNYTNTSGNWRTQSEGTWTSGFVPGMFWYLWDLTGEDVWQTRAALWTDGVSSAATRTDNDTGFQIFDSAGLGYILTGESNEDYKQICFTGANTLVTERYNPQIGCFRSWDGGEDDPMAQPFEVNIDQLMNLELILWVGLNGGPAEYVDYAVSHADKTWENNVREDGSTFHVVAYKADGTVDYKRTHQGWKENSTWSRGQAWAVYGYTMIYRYTGLTRMLERAQACYDYFVTETLTDRDDFVPYSDFDAPLDNRNPRDTSAAAIVASAALELYTLTDEMRYLDEAESILTSLSSPEYLVTASDPWQSLLRAASEKWGEPEVGAIFGDYFFTEALWRYQTWGLGETGDNNGGDPSPWDQWPREGDFVYTGDFLGVVNTANLPWVYLYNMNKWVYIPEGALIASGAWMFVPQD